MKYTLDCEILDGLVFIDESYLSELKDADLLYEMDILLDVSGSSELICDFPNEDWVLRTGKNDCLGCRVCCQGM